MDEKDRIEKIMQIENLNSAQFAMETGIQTSTLSHILNGRNKVSLDVLKKILNRFHNISSDWLILGVGSMFRQEKHSQSPTLFDFENKNNSESMTLIENNASKNAVEKNVNYENNPPLVELLKRKEEFSVVVEKNPRKISRIIVYFDDNSFQEFLGE